MKFDFVSKYFPSPKYLRPTYIGISFTDTNIKAVLFDKDLLNPKPLSMVVPLEKGSIVAGSIVNHAGVVEALTQIKGKFNYPFVFFTIPDEFVYVFLTSVPVSSSRDLRESVAFTIEENVPLSLADTVFDFVPTKVSLAQTGYNASLVVTACVKKELDKFVSVLNEAGFEVLGSMHESQAVSNALLAQGSSGASCVVHARENRVGIYFSIAGVIHFVTIRSIVEGDYGKQFLDEYDKFWEYCLKYNTDENGAIQNVFVCGEFEYAKKVVSTLAVSSKKIEVQLGNVWTNVLSIEKKAPNITFEDSLSLAGPIGVLLNEPI